jgi:hypothetical protein
VQKSNNYLTLFTLLLMPQHTRQSLLLLLLPGHMARGHASGAFQYLASSGAAHHRPNAARQQQQHSGSSTGTKQALQPNQNNMQKLSSRICVRDDPLDSLDGHKLSAGVANTLKVNSAKAAAARVRAGDKSDRATVEQALDPRTRMVSSCSGTAVVALLSSVCCGCTAGSCCVRRWPHMEWQQEREVARLTCSCMLVSPAC